MRRFKIFFLNSIVMIITSFVLQIIKLTFNIYISNRIGAEALGIFQLVMVTYFFGITLASSGINISCIRIISEELAFGNDYGVRSASKKCIKIGLLLSVIASFIFFVKADFIVKYCFQNRIDKNVVYLICSALPLISMSSAINGYFIAVRRVYKTAIGQILEQISKIISIVILLNIFSSSNQSLENICFILILGDVISEIIAFIYSIIVYIFDIHYHFSTFKTSSVENFIFRICRILLPVSLTSCIKSSISTTKQLIIPSSLEKSGKNSTESLSEYGIISGMAMPIIMFPASFLVVAASLLIPEFSRYYAKKDFKKIKLYTNKLLIVSFLFSTVLAILFYTFANNIGIAVYHQPEVSIYIKLFSLLMPFMYVDIIIDNILKGLDAQTNVIIINIIDALLTTTFIFFFVPVYRRKGLYYFYIYK